MTRVPVIAENNGRSNRVEQQYRADLFVVPSATTTALRCAPRKITDARSGDRRRHDVKSRLTTAAEAKRAPAYGMNRAVNHQKAESFVFHQQQQTTQTVISTLLQPSYA